MGNNVIALPTASSIIPDQEDKDIIEMLEKVLDRARAGEYKAMTISFVLRTSHMGNYSCGRYSDILSSLMTAQHDLMKDFRGS